MSAFSFIIADEHEQHGATTTEAAHDRPEGFSVQPVEDAVRYDHVAQPEGAAGLVGMDDIHVQVAGPLDPGMFGLGSSATTANVRGTGLDLLGGTATSGVHLLTGSGSPRLLEQLQSTFANGSETTAAAQLEAQIAEQDGAVRDLAERIAALELQKTAAVNAKDFRTASRLSKKLHGTKGEQATKQMELSMMKAARSSQTLEKWVNLESDGEAIAGPQVPTRTLAPGWQRLPSKDYPGRYYYYHEASDVSQWEAPPSDGVKDVEAENTVKTCSVEAALADLVRERERREAAEERTRAIEQELAALKSNLEDEISAARELRTTHHAAQMAAEQEKASAVAAAHQAGVIEGREQMEDYIQELQERIQSSTTAVAAAQAEILGVKADLTDALAKHQAAEATNQELRLKLEATGATSVPDEYTESESELESESEPESDSIEPGSELTNGMIQAAGEQAEKKCPCSNETQPRAERIATSPRHDGSLRTVSVTFTEPGSLGLKLSSSKSNGKVQLIGINKGTQAERQPQICPGMTLVSVAGLSATDRSYKDVLEIIKRSTRPVTMTFAPPNDDSGTVAAMFTQPGALGMRFAKGHGHTVELVHINPRSQAANHAQLQPGLVVHSVRGAPCSGKTFREVLRQIKLPERPVHMVFKVPLPDIKATFTEAGSLGLSFTHNKETDVIEVLQVSPGTQAVKHPQLVPGLTLYSIGGMNVKGMKYTDVIALLRASGRPVLMAFRSQTAKPSLGNAQTAEEALATGSNGGMRVVIPRGEWRNAAAAKTILNMQQADEEEVAGLPQGKDQPRPEKKTSSVQEIVEAKVAEARALAISEVASAADARVSKAREERAEELIQLRTEHAAAVQRHNEVFTAQQADHRAMMKQVETANRERDEALAKCEQHQGEQEAHYQAKLQQLLREMETKDRLHTRHLATAARLEDRWKDEQIFVCHFCQKSVISL